MRVVVRSLVKSLGCPGKGFVIEYRRNEKLALESFAPALHVNTAGAHVEPWNGMVLGQWEGGGPTRQGPGRRFVPIVLDTRQEAEAHAKYAKEEDNVPWWEYRVRDAKDLCLVQDQDKGAIYAVPKMEAERLR